MPGGLANDSIAENGQNSETSPGDLRRLTVTQTPVKNHQLTLMWKTLKEYKQLIYNISHDKTWTWLRKGNFKRKTESFLIAAQNSTIRTNHIKARIDKTQQNSKCRLCGDRDETIYHVISECCKFAQKVYKARHDWVVEVTHWERCKKFKFDHANKFYLHNLAPVLENDIHKLLCDFDIQKDQLISTRRPDLILINKKKKEENLQNCRLSCASRPLNKTERMWKER